MGSDRLVTSQQGNEELMCWHYTSRDKGQVCCESQLSMSVCAVSRVRVSRWVSFIVLVKIKAI